MHAFLFVTAAALLLIQACFWAFRLRDILQNFRAVPIIEPDREHDSAAPLPKISVIVPAHNEEGCIRRCLESVLDQDYANFELILVDDRSCDATLREATRLAEERGDFKIISLKDLPPYWTGKCHALSQGVEHAAGEWLAFLDADSTIEKSALRQCYFSALGNNVNMVTLTPRFVLKTFWEKALQPAFAAMSCILFPLAKINDPKSSVASANGMFYLISKKAYDEIGGHAGVRSLAVEDIGIGKRVKALGLGLLFANGHKILQTRMYTRFTEILGGWTRILSASMNYELSVVLKYLLLHVLVSCPATLAAIMVYISYSGQYLPMYWAAVPVVIWINMSVTAVLYCSQLGIPRKYGAFLCLGNILLIWVFVVIAVKIVRKDALQWRGTTYCENVYQPTFLEPVRPEGCSDSSRPPAVKEPAA